MSEDESVGVLIYTADSLRKVDSVSDVAAILRQLRRRHARMSGNSLLTYRELGARTGWALGTISEYFSGRRLPPTDRFDTLVRLLGASAAEQGVLATVRDRVEERRWLADRRRIHQTRI